MRKFILFILIFIALRSHSQISNANEYRKSIGLDKFVGTWKWQSGTSILIIKMKKIKYENTRGFYQDILLGVHSYIESGVVVEDSLHLFSNNNQDQRGTFTISSLGDSMIVSGSLWDGPKHKTVQLILCYLEA